MQLVLRIKQKDKPSVAVVTQIVDLIAFEQEYDVSIGGLSDTPKLTHLTWLAWHAQKRKGDTTLDFMDWAADLEDIEGEEASDPVPLEPVLSTGA